MVGRTNANSNLKTVELVADGSALQHGDISIDLTSVDGYANLTADDFLVELSRVQINYQSTMNSQGVGVSITKTYDASTGILKLAGVGTNTLGTTVNFYVLNSAWTTYYKVYRIY